MRHWRQAQCAVQTRACHNCANQCTSTSLPAAMPAYWLMQSSHAGVQLQQCLVLVHRIRGLICGLTVVIGFKICSADVFS